MARADKISSDRIPQLSVVAVSRNDNHGGDMLGRMQHFVNGIIAQCCKHRLKAELILVEWNPPGDRPALEEVLEWPHDFGPVTVRIVTVPRDVHARFLHAENLPLFQMIGKNVGIRRAKGRFVLATNIDILLDDETVMYLRDRLRPGTVVRVDRYDVPGDIGKGVLFDRVLAECRRRCFQVNTRFGILDVRRRRFVGLADGIQWKLLALYTEIRIFGLGDPFRRTIERMKGAIFSSWMALRRFAGGRLASWYSGLKWTAKAVGGLTRAVGGIARFFFLIVWQSPGLLQRNAHKLWPLRTLPSRGYWYVVRTLRRIKPQIESILPRPLPGVFRAISWLLRRLANFWRTFRFAFRRVARAGHLRLANFRRTFRFAFRQIAKAWHLLSPWHFIQNRGPFERRFARSQRLHTWACGDFTLAAREDWFHLRGYPEWPMYSWHIDSAFMFAASAHDIREIVLGPRYRIYHIDHSLGSGWSPSGQEQLFGRLKSRGIPFLSDDELREWQIRVAKSPADAVVNAPDWGLAGCGLPERSIGPGRCNQYVPQPAVIKLAAKI